MRLPGSLVRFIHIDRTRRLWNIREIILRHTSNCELRRIVVSRAMHTWRKGGEFKAVVKTKGFDLFSRERGNGDANILDGFFAFLRGNDDFLQKSALRQDARREVKEKDCNQAIDTNNEAGNPIIVAV